MKQNSESRNIGILIYNRICALDAIGPYEVFQDVNEQMESQGKPQNNILFIAKTLDDVVSTGALVIRPNATLDDASNLDILVVPGGQGSRTERYDKTTQAFILETYQHTEYLLSVCTGSLILAETGLLDGVKAATHHLALKVLREYPEIDVVEGVNFTHDGKIICGAGVTSGIDAALHVVKQLYGVQIAKTAADNLEYSNKFR